MSQGVYFLNSLTCKDVQTIITVFIAIFTSFFEKCIAEEIMKA